ncbi:MAG TPA: hypothetical protein VL147_05325 [Devosia sp.]|nr:hypothetical protein [Devosia sp.]
MITRRSFLAYAAAFGTIATGTTRAATLGTDLCGVCHLAYGDSVTSGENNFGKPVTQVIEKRLGAVSYNGPYDFSAAPDEQRIAVETQIAAFLTEPKPVRTFDCAMWPAQTLVRSFEVELNSQRFYHHRSQYYMMGAIGLIWRVTGPNWTALAAISAALGAGFLAGLYLLARNFVSPLAGAAIAAMVFFLSEINLFILTITRDYSKTFFISISLVILLLYLERSKQKIASKYEPALLGLFLGIGYGFR